MNIFNELIQGSFFSINNRSIGSFKFDVVTAESHESNLRVTENPIESGAMIADHSILEPKSVSIEATMVGYEPPKNFQNLVSKYTGFNIDKFNIPIPAELGAMTQQAIGAANRLIGNIANAEQTVHRVLAPWLPDYVPFTSDFSPTLDRVAQAYTELQSIQKSGEPITVKTGIRQYNDLVLTSIAVSQQDDNSAQFYISLREILIVETQTASGLKVDAPKATRSANQSAPVQNQGRTQPQVVNTNKNGQEKSGIVRIWDFFNGK